VDPLLFLLRLADDATLDVELREEAEVAALTWMAGGADRPWHRVFRARAMSRNRSPRYGANHSFRELRQLDQAFAELKRREAERAEQARHSDQDNDHALDPCPLDRSV
jgi:hypothetical protein